MTDFTEKKILSKKIYKGRFLDIREDIVRLPNGNKSTREWINHPGAVCMIPILPDNRIALIRQYRYPVSDHMIEIPAGKLDRGENPLNCAKRELEEEIGFKGNKFTFLTHIHPAIGFANEKMWIYLVEELEKTKPKLDEDEFLEIFPIKLDIALKMIWESKITDVKTIIGLLWLNKLKKLK